MIVFSAIVPHSPLLLPSIGKEHQKKLLRTLKAYETLEEELYSAKPETIVIISPHGTILPKSFTLFIAPQYQTDLREFGDLRTVLQFSSDLKTAEEIRMLRHGKETVPITAITNSALDYGSAIPLHLLTRHLPQIRIVPLAVSSLSLRQHFKAGTAGGEALHSSGRRIALVASADLAHTLTDSAPGGFSPQGKEFDETVVQALRKNTPQAIVKLESKMETAKACGLRPIVLLLGMLASLNYTFEPLSYEGPFGVGYLTARFNFR